jgi:SRSO17 transposase
LHLQTEAVGKKANCQVSVEVVVSDGWIAAPVGGRLYLPESWSEDRERCLAAGIPEEVEFATNGQIVGVPGRMSMTPPPATPTFASSC